MKKVLLLVAVVAAFSFVSCTKDRTCTCTTTTTNGSLSVSTTDVVTFNKSLKKDARENCLSTTSVDGNSTTKKECKLK